MSDNEKNPNENLNDIHENDVFEDPNDLNLNVGEFEDLDHLDEPAYSHAHPDDEYNENLDDAQENLHDDQFTLGEDDALAGENEDAFDAGFDDLEAFGDEWNDTPEDMEGEEFGFTDENEEELDAAPVAASPIANLAQNKALKFGAIGAGGLAAIVVVYFFVLGGGGNAGGGALPQPVAQQQQQQQQQGNPDSAKLALSLPDSTTSNEPVGLMENLDGIPAIDAVDGMLAQNQDPNSSNAQLFNILDEAENMPVPNAQITNNAPIVPLNNNLDDGFGLPMPSAISTEMQLEGPKPGTSNDLPLAVANNTDTQGFDFFVPEDNKAVDPILGSGNNGTNEFSQVTPVETAQATPPAPLDFGDFDKSRETVSVSVDTNAPAAVSNSAIETQLSRLNDRLDRMDSRIENLERGNNSSNSSDLSRLETAIQRLESRIESLADNNVMASNNVNSSSKSTSSSSSSSVKKASVSKSAPAPKKSSSSANANSWSLRGASPNQAYVAKKGSDEIKTVRVGDRVAGLGTINFIGLEKGRWVVKTSGGSIRQ